MDQRAWKVMQRHLKYSESELDAFKENESKRNIVENFNEINSTEIRVRVVASRGCNSRHTVGQEIILDGAGNILTSRSPSKICIYLLSILPSFVYAVNELLYAGVPAEEIQLRFNRAGCFDVGVENCGWGRVIVEVDVVPKTKAA